MCEAEIGEISDKDGSNFAPVDVDMDAMDDEVWKTYFSASAAGALCTHAILAQIPLLDGTTPILCPLSQSR